MILEFANRDLIFFTEDSANKVTASSRVGKVDSGSDVGDVGFGGVGVVLVGGSE